MKHNEFIVSLEKKSNLNNSRNKRKSKHRENSTYFLVQIHKKNHKNLALGEEFNFSSISHIYSFTKHSKS